MLKEVEVVQSKIKQEIRTLVDIVYHLLMEDMELVEQNDMPVEHMLVEDMPVEAMFVVLLDILVVILQVVVLVLVVREVRFHAILTIMLLPVIEFVEIVYV